MNAKHLMSVVAAAMSLAAFSAEVWTNVADKEPSVKTALNWEDGSAPAFNNLSEPVDVEFSDEPDFLQTIKWDAAHNSDYIWYVGDVSGDSRRRIALNKDNSRELRIADASGFQGYIRSFHASGLPSGIRPQPCCSSGSRYDSSTAGVRAIRP